MKAAFLVDPVDTTRFNPESPANPSATKALAAAGRPVGLAGAGIISSCNPEGSNWKVGRAHRKCECESAGMAGMCARHEGGWGGGGMYSVCIEGSNRKASVGYSYPRALFLSPLCISASALLLALFAGVLAGGGERQLAGGAAQRLPLAVDGCRWGAGCGVLQQP